jgi:hypothetical protein
MMRIMPLLKYQRILKWRWKMIQPMSTNTYPLMPNRVQSLMVPTSSKFTKDLKWKFAEVTEGSVPFTNIKSLYVGQTQLHPGIGDLFSTPFECFQRMGCHEEIVSLLAQHSNDYAKLILLAR